MMGQLHVDRRTFLKHSAALAGAAALPASSAQRAFAQEQASSRLRVGCIGTGGRGTYVGNIACELGEKVACADVDANHAKWFAGDSKCDVYED